MKSQKVISEVFEMFVITGDYPKDRKFPFKQGGYYCATDAHSVIRISEKLIKLPYKKQNTPKISAVIPTDLHEPIEIDVKKLESEIKRLTPMIHEITDCNNCEDGEVQCDLGHWHECDICYGEGFAKLTSKKIPDKATEFLLYDSEFLYPQLHRLVKASKLMGVKKIFKVFGTERKPSLFKVGEATILIAPVVNGKNGKKIEL